MYAGKTVSYKTILDKVIRDFGFNYDIHEEEGLEWLAEFMAHTNVPMVLENNIAYIEICDGRGELPFDLHKIGQVSHLTSVNNLEEAECGKGRMFPMRWATDYFHKRYHLDDRDYTSESDQTYTVQGNFIFTSFNKGFVAMSYNAIPTDEDGYPTIPAEQQWLEAGSHYIGHKVARKLWMQGHLRPDVYQIIERDRDWYFAQAVNHAKQWNGVDEAESMQNATLRTIPDVQAHASFFANMQLPEQRHFRDKSGARTQANISIVSASVQGPNPATS
jgi:hypothetical protein